jgi:hypothetical protein
MLTTIGISALGFLLQWGIGVRAFYLTVQIIGTVMVAYILVAFISFAGNLVRAPAIRDGERNRQIDSLTRQLRNEFSREEIINK